MGQQAMSTPPTPSRVQSPDEMAELSFGEEENPVEPEIERRELVGWLRKSLRSRSNVSSGSGQRNEEWRVNTHFRVPQHEHSCGQCENFFTHLSHVDEDQNKSLERAFNAIRRRYNANHCDEVMGLKARLDEARDTRDRDVARLKRSSQEGARWKAERDSAQDRVRELEKELEWRNTERPASGMKVPKKPVGQTSSALAGGANRPNTALS